MSSSSRSRSGPTSAAATVLLLVGVAALVGAVAHPTASVVEIATARALAGEGAAVVIPGAVVVESAGLALVSVAATVIGLALALARAV